MNHISLNRAFAISSIRLSMCLLFNQLGLHTHVGAMSGEELTTRLLDSQILPDATVCIDEQCCGLNLFDI